MAWIKMRTDLRNDPAVISLMAITGLDECTVLGSLYRIWAWADSVSEDGTVAHLSPVRFASYMDRELAADGFVQAMHEVGWLRVENDRVVFPNYDRHMSQSAKKRSADAVRKAEERVRETSAKKRTNVRKRADKTRTREEKSREDKRTAEKSREEETQDTDSLRSSVRAAAKRRPAGETLTAERLAFATSEGLAEDSARRAWAKMGDHEFPRPRSDWDATWRNWVRTEVERAVPPRAPAYQTAAQRSMSNLKNFLKESGAL